MNKKEYLEALKNELTLLSEEERKKVVRSYRIKINTMVNRGMSEADVLRTLGTPKALTNKIYKENGIKLEKKNKTSKAKLKDTLKINIDEIKKTLEEKSETKNQKKEEFKKNKVVKEKAKKESDKEENKKVSKEKKEKTKVKKGKPLKEESQEVVKEIIEQKEEKENKKVLKKKKKINKKANVEEVVEQIENEQLTLDIEQKEVIESKKEEITNVELEKTSTLLIKQAMNLICLIVCLVMIYYPFKLVDTYAMHVINKLELGLTMHYIMSFTIYTLYLVVCVTSLTHYLEHITDNNKIKFVNVLSQKVKKIILILLEIPMMLFVIVIATVFFMSCFLYLDGLKVIGIPVAMFGILVFAFMLFTALRNKIIGKNKSFVYSFFTYLIPLLIMGAGFGISYKDIMNFDYIYDVDTKYTYKLIEKEFALPDEGEYRINFNTNYHTQYTTKTDKKLKNKIRLEVTYYKDFYNLKTVTDKSSLYVSLSASPRRKISIFLENIKDKQIYSFNELERYEVTIYYNPKDANKILIEN